MSDTTAPSTSTAPSATPTPSAGASGIVSPNQSTPKGTPGADAAAKFEGGTPPAAEPTAEAVKKEIQRIKLKLKVDGKEDEREYTQDELSVLAQKGLASDKRFQESAELKKQVGSLIQHLRENPFDPELQSVLGVDLKDLIQKKLAEEWQQAHLTDEEKTQATSKKEAEAIAKERDELKKQIETQRNAELNHRVQTELNASFEEALTQQDLPKTYEALWHMADIAQHYLQNGVELNPQQKATLVKQRLDEGRSKLETSVRSGLTGDKLLSHLGESTVREVLKAALAKHKAGRAAPAAVPPVQKVAKEKPKEEIEEKKVNYYNSSKWRKDNYFGKDD